MNLLLRPSFRWLRAASLGLGIGLLAGGVEAAQRGLTSALDLTFAEAFLVGLCGCGFGALLAAPLGAVIGGLLQLIGRRWLDSKVFAASMGLTTFFVALVYVLQTVLELLEVGRTPGALAMLGTPIGFAGMVWTNAGYLFRKEELGRPARGTWLGVSAAGAVVLCLVSAGISSQRGYGSSRALAGDPNVLLITIDTLRRDHVGVYGAGLAKTPNLDKLADSGVLFLDAVTPTPETAPAHATLFTSLHTLRHKVLSNGDSLEEGHVTLAERLEDEGYATAAFVSSYAVNHQTGLDQGFELYDDDFFTTPRGLGQLTLARYAVKVLFAAGLPHLAPGLLERDGERTIDLAGRWISARGERPWFAWVHLFEPHAPYEAPGAAVNHRALLTNPGHVYTETEAAELRRLYALEVERVDALVGQLLATLAAAGADERTLIIVTADHGEQLGEHGIQFHHHGLYDESVRVPLLLRPPGGALRGRVVSQQVRLMDVAPTALKVISLDPMKLSEGVELLRYATGEQTQSLVADLFGRKTADLSQGCLFGLRSAWAEAPAAAPPGATPGAEAAPAAVAPTESGARVKYILDPDAKSEALYDLTKDPGELTNIAQGQALAVEAARSRAAPAAAATPCGRRDGGLGLGEQGMLEALGYVEGGDKK
ncbi:MAG: sulfatase [Deltaproteobacteria bacterium]|nr:sulfatase [Deltaproteobacteria bacterium]